MLRAAAVLAFAFATSAFAQGFILAGERLRFDAQLHPQFTPGQVARTAAVTRDGLVRWAGTEQGKAIIGRFEGGDREVTIVESEEEKGVGRAPQPGIATMVAVNDRSKLKRYELIVNPAVASQYANANSLAWGGRGRLSMPWPRRGPRRCCTSTSTRAASPSPITSAPTFRSAGDRWPRSWGSRH